MDRSIKQWIVMALLNQRMEIIIVLLFIPVLLLTPISPAQSLGRNNSFLHIIVDYTTNANVVSIGDVDGDGFPDVIAAKEDWGLTWYKYPDWGKYSIQSFNWRADDIGSADIDGDGDVDVVGVQDDDGKVYWFENPRPSGNPADTWASHYIGNNGDFVKELEIADFNTDGKLDVVTRTENTTSIFLQENSASWNKVKTISHCKREGLDVGDLDRDDDPDIVLNGFWLENPYPSLSGTWYEHNIDSKWWNQSTGQWQDNSAKVFVIDLNGDGSLDVLISQSEKPGYPVSWYEASNPKNGSWTEHVIGYLDYCHTLQAGDMDNDGDMDVVAGKFERPDNAIPPLYLLKVYYNENGDGLSWKAQGVDDLGIYSGVIGDIGNDGDIDIAGSRSYWKGPIEIRENKRSDNKLPLDQWTYIEVDNSRGKWGDWSDPSWMRYFGLAIGDLTGDGYGDVVSGRYFYGNPGGNMTTPWQRIDLGYNVDASFIVDVDGDEYGDIIAQALPDVWWFEANDILGSSWTRRKLIGTVPVTEEVLSQQYAVGQIIPGGKPEILIEGGDGVCYFQIPPDPATDAWPCVKIIGNGGGYATGDIDGDGYFDVVGGNLDTKQVLWWKNPGDGNGNWTEYSIGSVVGSPDRYAIADIDGDERKDIVVSEEEYPVTQGISHCYWFKANPNPQKGEWQRNAVVSGAYSLNSMSVADMDRDGDIDIVLGEMGGQQRHMIFENDRLGNFSNPIILDTDMESHLGARVADLDRDGDLEIISIGWNEYQYLHVWRNDAIQESQSAAADVNNDGGVDIRDIARVARAYDSKPGDYNWNDIADLNGDGWINIPDLYTVASNFGKTDI